MWRCGSPARYPREAGTCSAVVRLNLAAWSRDPPCPPVEQVQRLRTKALPGTADAGDGRRGPQREFRSYGSWQSELDGILTTASRVLGTESWDDIGAQRCYLTGRCGSWTTRAKWCFLPG